MQKILVQPLQIIGNVVFGNGCFVHPGTNINAEGGDIIFGDYNIIEVNSFLNSKERVVIHNKKSLDASGN